MVIFYIYYAFLFKKTGRQADKPANTQCSILRSVFTTESFLFLLKLLNASSTTPNCSLPLEGSKEQVALTQNPSASVPHCLDLEFRTVQLHKDGLNSRAQNTESSGKIATKSQWH
uniref:Uncharacterized protein n=1 Tax=Sphaerodactylus townsendi TaxID=933632 RepID=A0ACB8FV63_9SAUR